MRYLIISDIHGNLEALHAVLADAEGDYDSIVNCGDLVGYGASPNEIVQWSRDNGILIRGNHDVACASLENLDWFNDVAQTSAVWTHEQLSPENLSFLKDLPAGPLDVDGFQICHGSPEDENEYIVTESEARRAASHFDTGLLFFGHTHLQGVFAIHRNGTRLLEEDVFTLDPAFKYMVNPGSVGQPRNYDPRACYALYDAKEQLVSCRRVPYDIETAHSKIVKAGLPEVLGRRLFVGI